MNWLLQIRHCGLQNQRKYKKSNKATMKKFTLQLSPLSKWTNRTKKRFFKGQSEQTYWIIKFKPSFDNFSTAAWNYSHLHFVFTFFGRYPLQQIDKQTNPLNISRIGREDDKPESWNGKFNEIWKVEMSLMIELGGQVDVDA